MPSWSLKNARRCLLTEVPRKDNHLVSIIIPTYNYGHYLPDAIESALNQTYPNIEVIVVDDGSTDNTKDIIGQYPVKYIRQKHQGTGVALNNGISKSTGEFFVCLGADDKIFPEFVAKTIKFMEKPNVAFVCVGSKVWNEQIGLEDIWIPHKIYTKYALFAGWIGVLGCTLMRRAAFETLEYGFDPNLPLYEDLDLCFRLLLKGWKMKIIPEPLHWYRIHRGARNFARHETKRLVEDFLNRKYRFIEPWKKIYLFYQNTWGRIVSLMTHPIEYLQGIKKKIKNCIQIKYYKWNDIENKELAQELAYQISLTIDRKIEWYWKHKWLRYYYEKKLKRLEAKLQEICCKDILSTSSCKS